MSHASLVYSSQLAFCPFGDPLLPKGRRREPCLVTSNPALSVFPIFVAPFWLHDSSIS